VCDLLNLDRAAVVQAVRAQLGGDAGTDTMRARREKIAGSFRAARW
jgi:Arc/MetJ family transcription regulator